MKISSLRYYIKEGIHSIIRNRMMSIASISTVMVSLLLFGLFFITVVNVNEMVKTVEKSVEIKVFIKDSATNDQMSMIVAQARNAAGISDVIFESKQQALENFKKQLGENSDLVSDIDPEKVMPRSYIIKLEGPQYVDGLVESIKALDGIDKINDARPIMDKLMKITGFARMLGLSLMGILLVVAVFLISNTIKLTVIARKRQIGIMKYIGATDWFIRWPFIIEGVLLGLIGSSLSAVILGYGYMIAVDSFAKNLILVQLVDPMNIVPFMAAVFLAVGTLLGSIGSMISLRKFLKV